jgi:WD40 repeat protein
MLFKFECDVTKDRTVSSSDWNSVNQDLLAVSYGEFDFNSNQDGILAFWTLKNPSFPERIIRYPSRITTCQFSKNNPNLIAGGTHNGIVAIWDIRKQGNQPILANNDQNSKGKHSDCVWEVQWVGKGQKGGESLVSISSDGRVVEWSMKKGLEFQDLMNLKRQNNPSQKEGQNEGVNFRQAAGFSFEFIKSEPNIYLASTEEATVYRCSKSYAETVHY